LPALHQRPPGTTDPTRRSSAMQLHRIGIAEDAPGRHLLVDLSATGFSD
jgi:hypothetical protein